MLQKTANYLLAKTDIGQVKKGFHQLPSDNHVYGRAPQKDTHGAREMISGWDQGTKTTGKTGGKNYVAMNREGIKHGCIDSKQVVQYRKQNQMKVKVKQGQKTYGVNIPDQDFVFGISNRPSTPMKNVICNSYAITHEDMAVQKQAVMKMLGKEKKSLSKVDLSPKKKKQDISKKKQIESNNFKLSKFQNVPSKIKPLIGNPRA